MTLNIYPNTLAAQRGRQPRRHPLGLKTQPEGPHSRLRAPPRQRRRLDAVLGGLYALKTPRWPTLILAIGNLRLCRLELHETQFLRRQACTQVENFNPD
jgi:hypothetical protein